MTEQNVQTFITWTHGAHPAWLQYHGPAHDARELQTQCEVPIRIPASPPPPPHVVLLPPPPPPPPQAAGDTSFSVYAYTTNFTDIIPTWRIMPGFHIFQPHKTISTKCWTSSCRRSSTSLAESILYAWIQIRPQASSNRERYHSAGRHVTPTGHSPCSLPNNRLVLHSPELCDASITATLSCTAAGSAFLLAHDASWGTFIADVHVINGSSMRTVNFLSNNIFRVAC